MSGPAILSVEELNIHFGKGRDRLHAVRDLSFSVAHGETLGIVGESGCGKSITALALMGLLPPPGHVSGRRVGFDGENLLTLPAEAMRRIRIGMIFQEPMTALNPVLTIGEQIVEAITEHEALPRRAARERALALIERVRISDPERRFAEYPHQLSGGMRQRVMIAMAIAGSPALLIADEPTTALDVTIRAEILQLIDALKAETGTAVVLITHDLGLVSEYAGRVLDLQETLGVAFLFISHDLSVVEHISDRVAVMYLGCIVEIGDRAVLFQQPAHPYTRALLEAVPRIGRTKPAKPLRVVSEIPSPYAPPSGCPYRTRCHLAVARCADEIPVLRTVPTGQNVACHLA